MEFAFDAVLVEWRGPAPYVFAPIPAEVAEEVRALAPALTYGWGVVPVGARIGGSAFATSLFPRQGGYLLPVRAAVQRAEGIAVGDRVRVTLTLAPAGP